MPSSSRTEQTILALRKVVHLFTRLRCPPMSFCSQQWIKETVKIAITAELKEEKNLFGLLAYRTDPGHHGVDVLGVPAVVRQPLTEEEVELGIVGVRAVRDQVSIDEYRL